MNNFDNPKTLSRKLVRPSKATPNHLQHFKLSLLDQLAPPVYVNLVLYYPNHNPKDTTVSTCLEKSLSEALTNFYPLAGRFMQHGFYVDCSDQGVEYLDAQATGSLFEFLNKDLNTDELNLFVPWDIGLPNEAASPLAAIQVTMFSEGGFVVGVRLSHMIADASTVVTFINEWAKLSCGSSSSIFPISNKFVSIFPANGCSFNESPPPPPPTPPPQSSETVVTKTFVFPGETIAKIKENISSQIDEYQPTRVVAVTALIWRAIIRAKNEHLLKDSMLSIAINLRQKTGVLANKNSTDYFGNGWTSFLVHFEPHESEVGLHTYAKILSNRICNIVTFFSNARSDEILSMLNNYPKEVIAEILNNNAFICSSWCKFPYYESDFGWGKPSWVSGVADPMPKMVLLDTKSGDGIEAWISLNEKEMAELLNDPFMLAAANSKLIQNEVGKEKERSDEDAAK